MSPFLITMAVIAALMPLALAIIAARAPLGWEDDAGFHDGVPDQTVHNGEVY